MKITIESNRRKFEQDIFVIKNIKEHMGTLLWEMCADAMFMHKKGILQYIREKTPRSKKQSNQHLQDFYRRLAKKEHGRITEISLSNIHPKAKELLKYLEYGTKPHIIKGNPVLHFEIDSESIWARIVHHPGTKPLGFIKETEEYIEEWLGELEDTLNRRVEEELSRVK